MGTKPEQRVRWNLFRLEKRMKSVFLRMGLIVSVLVLSTAACAPAAPPTPTVDVVGSLAVQMADSMQTQTASAYTPPPSSTPTAEATDTPTAAPTGTPAGNIVTLINRPPCYFGPGSQYPMESYINTPKKVEAKGVGSVPGWFIIMNPYFHQLCWVEVKYVQTPSGMDPSILPVMTPAR